MCYFLHIFCLLCFLIPIKGSADSIQVYLKAITLLPSECILAQRNVSNSDIAEENFHRKRNILLENFFIAGPGIRYHKEKTLYAYMDGTIQRTYWQGANSEKDMLPTQPLDDLIWSNMGTTYGLHNEWIIRYVIRGMYGICMLSHQIESSLVEVFAGLSFKGRSLDNRTSYLREERPYMKVYRTSEWFWGGGPALVLSISKDIYKKCSLSVITTLQAPFLSYHVKQSVYALSDDKLPEFLVWNREIATKILPEIIQEWQLSYKAEKGFFPSISFLYGMHPNVTQMNIPITAQGSGRFQTFYSWGMHFSLGYSY